jgi:cobalt/nickel transport system permease protein
MKQNTVDHYARGSTFLAIDPRIKIVCILLYIIIVAFLRDITLLTIGFCYTLSLIGISGVPFPHVMKTYGFSLPFIFFAALTMYISAGFLSSIAMFIRISTCVLSLLFLITCTPFFDMLRALKQFRIPKIFLSLFLFMYRYFFVIDDERHRMTLARKARGMQSKTHLFHRRTMQTISFTAGMILVRSYERGKRIFDGLLSRHYTGEIKTLTPFRITKKDYVFFISLCSFSILLLYTQWRTTQWIL